MKLSENPIFITHKRLVHRMGVLAPVIIAALIGMVLLVGLAVGVDYSMFYLRRKLEERRRGAGRLQQRRQEIRP